MILLLSGACTRRNPCIPRFCSTGREASQFRRMTIRFPVSTKRRPRTRRSAWWGFSLLEVILAVGLLGFGIAIVMRLLTNSLETLQAVRGANQALDLVPVINLKLEDPSVDIPIDDDKGGLTAVGDSNVAFQRRFFNKIFNIINRIKFKTTKVIYRCSTISTTNR